MSALPYRLSTPQKEGVQRISKSLKHQVLVDEEEMRDLLDHLGTFSFHCVSEPVTSTQARIAKEEFLENYALYIKGLKTGELIDEGSLRRYFSGIATVSEDLLYAMDVGKERFLIKALRPVIQLQGHQFFVSAVDGTFHPMVLGRDSVSWGLQFSYPQIYQHPQSHSFSKVIESEEFPNTTLFKRLARWLRTHTAPTPFQFLGKRTNVPMRLGKKCFAWIHQHPQLISKGIQVVY